MPNRAPRLIHLPLATAMAAASLLAPALHASYKDDLLADLDQLQTKIVGLAEAIPDVRYEWRPAEGVRGVAQVLGHVAGTNYYFPTLLGMKPPVGYDMQALEQNIGKKSLLQNLNSSFAFLRKCIANMTDEQLAAPLQLFGQEVTGAGFAHAALAHSHEHLGQLIAYARSLGVTPPWSQQETDSDSGKPQQP